jgi:hypothetical protein
MENWDRITMKKGKQKGKSEKPNERERGQSIPRSEIERSRYKHRPIGVPLIQPLLRMTLDTCLLAGALFSVFMYVRYFVDALAWLSKVTGQMQGVTGGAVSMDRLRNVYRRARERERKNTEGNFFFFFFEEKG